MTQKCCTCKNELPLSCFRKDSTRKSGHGGQCKACRRLWYEAHREEQLAYSKKWYYDNYERSRRNTKRSNLRSKFGITLEDFEALKLRQENKCAICGKKYEQELSVDHDHKTGKVRGLLCSRCNFGIGQLDDSPTILASAIKYLKGEV